MYVWALNARFLFSFLFLKRRLNNRQSKSLLQEINFLWTSILKFSLTSLHISFDNGPAAGIGLEFPDTFLGGLQLALFLWPTHGVLGLLHLGQRPLEVISHVIFCTALEKGRDILDGMGQHALKKKKKICYYNKTYTVENDTSMVTTILMTFASFKKTWW